MKKVLLVAVLAFVAWHGLQQGWFDKVLIPKQGYSLAKIAERPIPRSEFFALWRETAERGCDDAKEKHNLTPKACLASIDQKHSACERSAGLDSPALIGNVTVSRSLARKYLQCVTPYFFCNGIEVRTEDEVRQHCQPST